MKTTFSVKLSTFLIAILFVFMTVGCSVSLQEEVPSSRGVEGGDVVQEQPLVEEPVVEQAVEQNLVAVPNPVAPAEEPAVQPAVVEPAPEVQPTAVPDLVQQAAPVVEPAVVQEESVAPAPQEPEIDLSAGTNEGQAVVHIVRPRDTIGTIAQGYNVSIDAIMAANPWVSTSFLIKAGDELMIPPAGSQNYQAPAVQAPAQDNSQQGGYTSYYVQYGDTMGIIAQNYGYSMDELANYNGITNINQISVGQEIRIPNR